MAHFVSALVGFAGDHALLAYVLAFLLAGLESVPAVGAVVPGTATIVAMAALAPSGVLAVWPLIVATTAGAVAGDGFSYWLGHHYKGHAAALWPLRRNPAVIEIGKAFFARHGGKAVLIARFTPGVRAIVPVVAGMLEMPAARFYAVNLLSAALWAPAHIAIGVAIGASLAVLGAIAGRLAALAVGLLLIVWLVVWATPRLVRRLGKLAAPLADRLRRWTLQGDSWPQRQLRFLFGSGRAEIRGLALVGALLAGCFWLLIGVAQDVVAGDPLMRADRAVLHFFESLRLEWVDRLAVVMAALGGMPVTLGVGAAMLAWLASRRAWRAALYELAALAGAAALPALLLLLPAPAVAPADSASLLPAWQMTQAVALYTFLAVAVARDGSARTAVGISVAVTLLLTLFGFARLYLGIEWLSTLLLASAFAVAWVTVLSVGYLAHRHRAVRPAGLLAATTLAFLASGGATFAFGHAEPRRPPTLRIEVMPLAQWHDGGWQKLPARRVDLFGERREPLDLQWAGRLAPLEAELAAHDWRPAVAWSWRSALGWLSPGIGPAALPVLPHLDDGRPEALVMMRTGPPLGEHQRVVLRVWPVDVRLTQGTQRLPLWVGAVTIERVRPVSFLFAAATAEKRAASALAMLHDALPATVLVHRVGAAGQLLLGEAPAQAARLNRAAGVH